jgi:hypothetical protein
VAQSLLNTKAARVAKKTRRSDLYRLRDLVFKSGSFSEEFVENDIRRSRISPVFL